MLAFVLESGSYLPDPIGNPGGVIVDVKMGASLHTDQAHGSGQGNRVKFFTAGIALLASATGQVHAADLHYPTKPIRLVVPFPPGGGTDTLARVIGQSMSLELAQQIVIDNRGGAGGLVGTEIAARAVPDGYTLLLGTASTHGSNPSLYKKLPYDAIADFSPVILLAVVANILVVNASVDARSIKDLIALAKQKPGFLNYASVGIGSSQHLIAEMFKNQAKVDIVHVPYKGTGPALNALLSGQVQMMFSNLITSIPHVRANRLRGLAVTTANRVNIAPDLPTVAESLPGFSVTSWYGLLSPARTPQAVVEKLNRVAATVLNKPEILERLAMDGAEKGGGSPAQFEKHIRTEVKMYAEAVKVANIVAE